MTDTRALFPSIHHELIGVPPDMDAEAKPFYEKVLGSVPLVSPLD